MHVIKPYQPKLTLTCGDGSTRVYYSPDELLDEVGFGFIRYRVGPRIDFQADWTHTLVDEFGNILGAADFEELQKKRGPSPYLGGLLRRDLTFWNGTGPVPGTGRRGHYCYFRNIRTTQERRHHAFVDKDAGEPAPRAKRARASRLTSRDDILRSDHRHRSWKNQRKTQWKIKKER